MTVFFGIVPCAISGLWASFAWACLVGNRGVHMEPTALHLLQLSYQLVHINLFLRLLRLGAPILASIFNNIHWGLHKVYGLLLSFCNHVIIRLKSRSISGIVSICLCILPKAVVFGSLMMLSHHRMTFSCDSQLQLVLKSNLLPFSWFWAVNADFWPTWGHICDSSCISLIPLHDWVVDRPVFWKSVIWHMEGAATRIYCIYGSSLKVFMFRICHISRKVDSRNFLNSLLWKPHSVDAAELKGVCCFFLETKKASIVWVTGGEANILRCLKRLCLHSLISRSWA